MDTVDRAHELVKDYSKIWYVENMSQEQFELILFIFYGMVLGVEGIK